MPSPTQAAKAVPEPGRGVRESEVRGARVFVFVFPWGGVRGERKWRAARRRGKGRREQAEEAGRELLASPLPSSRRGAGSLDFAVDWGPWEPEAAGRGGREAAWKCIQICLAAC